MVLDVTADRSRIEDDWQTGNRVPGDVLGGSGVGRQLVGAQEPASVASDQERTVRPAAHELLVVPAPLDHHVGYRQR